MKYCRTPLLNPQENNDIESLLHGDEEALCTGVVELYVTDDSDNHISWHKLCIGILCLINNDDGYFLKLYCPIMKIVIWQHEYISDYSQSSNYFIQFHGKDKIYGINFSCMRESNSFIEAMKVADLEKNSIFGGFKRMYRSFIRPNSIQIGSPISSKTLTRIKDAKNTFNIDSDLEHILNGVGITVDDLKKSPEITETVYNAMVDTGDIILPTLNKEEIRPTSHRHLLEQIQNTKISNLKHVQAENRNSKPTDDLKSILTKVIIQRKKAVNPEDDDVDNDWSN